jgi:hypothetical protein
MMVLASSTRLITLPRCARTLGSPRVCASLIEERLVCRPKTGAPSVRIPLDITWSCPMREMEWLAFIWRSWVHVFSFFPSFLNKFALNIFCGDRAYSSLEQVVYYIPSCITSIYSVMMFAIYCNV